MVILQLVHALPRFETLVNGLPPLTLLWSEPLGQNLHRQIGISVSLEGVHKNVELLLAQCDSLTIHEFVHFERSNEADLSLGNLVVNIVWFDEDKLVPTDCEYPLTIQVGLQELEEALVVGCIAVTILT